VELESRVWRRAKISRQVLRGIVFHPPSDSLTRDQLAERITGRSDPFDRIWLANGDQLEGELQVTPDDQRGSLFGLAYLHFLPRRQIEPLVLEMKRVIAVALAEPQPALPSPRTAMHLGFRDGSFLGVSELEAVDGKVRLEMPRGLSLVADQDTFLGEITFIQPYGANVTYLADVGPSDYQHVPYLDRPWQFQRDRNVLGGRLRCGENLYLKGLGMHSTSRLVFDLDQSHRLFEADLAIDASGRPWGSVNGLVLLEMPEGQGGQTRWEIAHQSPTIRAGDAPHAIRVELRDARRLALVVGFAERGDVLDHANWLNARLVR
jgi:hypothetical protein